MKLELGDVQGLFARGYGDLKSAAFLLLKVEDAAAARSSLAELAVTHAEDRRPAQALNVAFTSSGLERLGLPAEKLATFSNEFVAGMTTPHRTRILGDIGENAPTTWDWGGPHSPVDAVLLLYARNDIGLAPLEQVPPGFSLVRRLGTADLDGFEPFGFRDGISQPFVEGLSKTGPPETTVKAGEFLLGYPKTRWLVFGGARNELAFKDYLRVHQGPIRVWYSAYGDLTALNVAQNERIRAGLRGGDARKWVQSL